MRRPAARSLGNWRQGQRTALALHLRERVDVAPAIVERDSLPQRGVGDADGIDRCMTIADRRADRQRRAVDRPRRVLVIEIYQPYPARLRFQMQQGSKGLAGSRPVDVMAVLQSEAEPVRQRCPAVNESTMRQSRVALAEGATESAGQSRSQGSALVLHRKPFAWCRIPHIHQVAGWCDPLGAGPRGELQLPACIRPRLRRNRDHGPASG
jgi:hypothetical protein